jgi:hypothetical protein
MNSNFCDVELILFPRYTRYVDLLISMLSRKKCEEWLMIHTAGSLPGESINHGCSEICGQVIHFSYSWSPCICTIIISGCSVDICCGVLCRAICWNLELFRQLMITGETFFLLVCTENCKKSSTEKLQNGIFPYLISQYFGVH